MRQRQLCAASLWRRGVCRSSVHTRALGGLTGADAICQDLADAASLDGVFRAWLSDDTATASGRLVHSTGPYQRRDGTTIANNWTDLTDGSLAHAINLTETGEPYSGADTVWTGTSWTGGYAGQSCSNWMLDTGVGDMGTAFRTNAFWTSEACFDCSFARRLYCFQQS